jgi:hypothetical protein
MRNRAGLTGAAALAAAAALAVPAQGAVTNGQALEVFHGRDFVNIVGYDPSTPLQVVVRNPAGEPIGFANVETDDQGNYELNHVGVDGGINDCFGGDSTPDIQPGDTVSVMVNGDAARVDSTVVQDVTADAPVVDAAAKTITVSGRARTPNGAALTNVEVRLNHPKPDQPGESGVWDAPGAGGRKDWRRAGTIDAAGNYTAVFTDASGDDLDAVADADMSAEWATPDLSELTVYDGVLPEPNPGCPPVGRNAVEVPAPVVETPAPAPDSDAGSGTGGGPVAGGTVTPSPRVITVFVQEPDSRQRIAGVTASPLRVSQLSVARRISLARLGRRGLQASMRLPQGTGAVRIAVHRARDGRRSGSALLVASRSPRAAGVYRVALRDRSLLRRMRPGQYVLEVRAGRSAATLGRVTRVAFRVIR